MGLFIFSGFAIFAVPAITTNVILGTAVFVLLSHQLHFFVNNFVAINLPIWADKFEVEADVMKEAST